MPANTMDKAREKPRTNPDRPLKNEATISYILLIQMQTKHLNKY